ncbi:uncharacterized protein LOC113505193 isoform X1 [Trichoplusia ni]|uniref:Uncharacterized protein LOC113505193 isoform X1 n=2 Tax=Trichoplusia ni TaxID=7111 RepID=A0A7E5WS04_TRINI|nr:uncharacterized protein LOC113505193 isoform X1 [Trichoplusia ni]
MEKILLVLLSTLTAINSTPVTTRQSLQRQKTRDQFCSNLLNFNNFFYSLEEQKNVTGIPADMSIHWKTGKIFFTLISDEMKMSLQVFQPGGELEIIKVAGLGQSTCVDNLNDIVYLATDNGVYKYKDDGSIELHTALGEDVMYIAVSSDGSAMYIATWPQNRVHKIASDGQKLEPFTAIPNGHGLTVDPRNNIYFVATKTSYILKNGYSIPIKIKGLPSDKMTGVFVSRSDEVFAMDENSNLYVVDPENSSARHLGSFSVSGVNSFAMDSADNVLIGVKGAILKFNAYEKSPCPEFSKKGKRHSRKRKTKKRTTTTPEPTEDEEEE